VVVCVLTHGRRGLVVLESQTAPIRARVGFCHGQSRSEATRSDAFTPQRRCGARAAGAGHRRHTGVGVPVNQLDYIYDEFYKVGVATRTSRDGYGLGLSICQRLIAPQHLYPSFHLIHRLAK
jgi:hypothetical protein